MAPGDRDPQVHLHQRWARLRLTRATALALTTLALFATAAVDAATGPYIVVATFYLLPVGTAAWFLGRRAGIVVALLSALSGMAATLLDPGVITGPVVVWNGVLRFVTFLVVALIVAFERRALQTIDQLASADPLTGLANRRHFSEQAAEVLAVAARAEIPVSFAYLDLDDLKVRNDRLGHESGDAMLVEFADQLRGHLRRGDLAARVGGDEFCLLLPNADLDEAQRVVERLMRSLRSTTPPISVSCGIVGGSSAAKGELADLMRRADELMMRAKKEGKQRVVSSAGDGSDEGGGCW